MKSSVSTQFIVAMGILLIGGGIAGGEYYLLKWYPAHQEAVKEATLKLTPYRNDALGIEMQVAAGIKKNIKPFSGGVRISSPRFWSIGPSLTITSQPNPDRKTEFTPIELAKWQSDGAQHDLPRYHFEHARINNRDAVLIWQYADRSMLLTARILAPDRLVEANCTPGRADEDLFMQACDETVRTIKVAGPPSPSPTPQGDMEVVAEPSATNR